VSTKGVWPIPGLETLGAKGPKKGREEPGLSGCFAAVWNECSLPSREEKMGVKILPVNFCRRKVTSGTSRQSLGSYARYLGGKGKKNLKITDSEGTTKGSIYDYVKAKIHKIR